MWQWTFSDTNGDGVANWIALGPAGINRDFYTDPVQSGEIGSKAVTDGKVADYTTDTNITESSTKFLGSTIFTFTDFKRAIVAKINGLFSTKVDKTTVHNKIYGTDGTGAQTVLDRDDLINVKSVDGVEAGTDKNIELSVEMTQAEYDALEDPPGSGLYPSLAGKTVTLKDVYPDNTRIPMPDYANMESANRITANHGVWTADRTGYIRVILSSLRTGQDHVTATINSTRIISQQLNGTTKVYSPDIDAVFSVNKGDIIQLTVQNYFDNVGCYFIPVKFV
jgi:hypothetical protein